MTNKVGVLSSKRGSSTPCKKWTMLMWSICNFSSVKQADNGMFKTPRQQRWWKLSVLWTLVWLSQHALFVWCKRALLELKSWEKYPSSKRERENRLSLFTISIQRETRHFHVLVAQWRQRNVQKNVIHVQTCYFADLRLCSISNSFLTATKIIPDIVSVHTQERSWRPDFCDGAKLPYADLERRASHVG